MTRTAAGLLVGLVVAVGARAEAQCINVVSGCFCFGATSIGVVVTEQTDGGSSSLRVESANAGLDAGAFFTMPSETGETVGSRWLLLDATRLPIDASGNVPCQYVAPEKHFSASAVASAAAGGSCEADMGALGLKQPPCNDTAHCSVSPVLLSPLLLLAWSARRRRQRRKP